MKREHFMAVIGAVAFVLGGIIARGNAIEGVEKLEKNYNDFKAKRHPDQPYQIDTQAEYPPASPPQQIFHHTPTPQQ